MRYISKLFLIVVTYASLFNLDINAQEQSECLKYLNFYSGYLKNNNYEDAINNWRKAFNNCPVRIGHKFYSDGADLYRHLASKNLSDESILDTLILLSAARAYIYPQYKQESLDIISSDLELFTPNNEQLKNHLYNEIDNIEQFLSSGSEKKYHLVSKVAVTNPYLKSGQPLTAIEIALIKGEISKELSRSVNYSAYTRTDIDKILEEIDFQNSGLVSEKERHRIGQLSGVDYICSINVTKESGTIYIESSLININTGEISSSSVGHCNYVSVDDTYALEITCRKIGQELIGANPYSRIQIIPSKNKLNANDKEYIETAFGIEMPFVYIKGGIYGEGTEHQQFIEPYYISTFLVTQQQWINVMGISQEELLKKYEYLSESNSIGAKHPVFCVTPQDALDFCKALSRMSGLNYDLPTSAEWKMAANKPSENYSYSGSDEFYKVGWAGKSMPVGLKQANSYGIFDMTGNVAEFCKKNNDFVLKGGKPWGKLNVSTTYTYSTGVTEETASPYIGFRIVLRVPND